MKITHRWKEERGSPPSTARNHIYFLLKQIHPRLDFPPKKWIVSESTWLCTFMLWLAYLRIKVHGVGQTASAIAEGCFATAEGHTVVFSLFEPDSILPVWIVMDPTAAQLENQRGKKLNSNCNTRRTSILCSIAEKDLSTTYLNTSTDWQIANYIKIYLPISNIIILILTKLSYLLSIQQFLRFVRMEEGHLHKQQSNSTCVLRTERRGKVARVSPSHLPLYIVNGTTGCIRICPIVSIVYFPNAVINFILHLGSGRKASALAHPQKQHRLGNIILLPTTAFQGTKVWTHHLKSA